MKRALRALIPLMALAGPLAGQVKSDSINLRSWLGCYAVTSETTFTHGGAQLDSFRLADRPVHGLVFILEDRLSWALHHPHWQPQSGYEIRVHYPSVRRLSNAPLGWLPVGLYVIRARVWSDGYVDASLELRRQGDSTLVGTGVLVTDYLNDGADSIPITARAIPCPTSAAAWPAK